MPLNFGTNVTQQIYQMKSGIVNCRAMYFGTNKIWPFYQIEAKANSINHTGTDNALKDYTLTNAALNPSPNPVDESMSPEFDPAGGTFNVGIYSKEDSAWHHLSFKLLVPAYVTLNKVCEDGSTTEVTGVTKTYTTTTFTGAQNKSYSAKEYTIDFDPSLNQSNEISSTRLDSGLRLYFTIDANNDSDFRVGDIVYKGYWDEFNNYVTNQWTITTFRQQPNFLYQTRAAWYSQPASALSLANSTSWFKGDNAAQTLTVNYSTTSTYLYMIVAFGISQDGGKNWYWGPMNDHRNSSNKLNITTGNVLSSIKNNTTVTVSQVTDSYDQPEEFTATVYDPMSTYNYWVVPIGITMNANNETNNPRHEIKYQWSSSNNTNWNPANIPGGSKTSGNQTSTRNLGGISRKPKSEARDVKVSVQFNWGKHEFKLG